MRLHKEGVDDIVIKKLNLQNSSPIDLSNWEQLVERMNNPYTTVKIAMVGKYMGLKESYKSLDASIKHAAANMGASVEILWIDAEDVINDFKSAKNKLSSSDGIIIPGGFGTRGIEGKIEALKFARTNKIPTLGICLGMQCAVIEFARNVLGYKDADSTEFNLKTKHPVIGLATSWIDKDGQVVHREMRDNKGGTMRLGEYLCRIEPGTAASTYYANLTSVHERHRHRYEFERKNADEFIEKGLKVDGVSEDGTLVEIIRLKGHPFYVGCQFHPEFQSSLEKPHPLFIALIRKSLQRRHR